MKKLDKFILNSYLAPFSRSLGITLFLLVLQFISRYKDQLFGKGLEAIVMVKIFLFASATLVVLALPVSILISSLMCMGSMGEHFELTSIRACGIPLPRIMRPMIFATLGIALFSFIFSIYIIPSANLKLYSLLYDIKQVKPSFSLKPGHFNHDIEGYVIRISDRDTDREMLYKIMIYDHTTGRANEKVILADSGSMIIDEDHYLMKMTLFNGISYEAIEEEGSAGTHFIHSRFFYDTLRYNFDMSAFEMSRTDEAAFSTHQYMQTMGKLIIAMDSIDDLRQKIRDMYSTQINIYIGVDSSLVEEEVDTTVKGYTNPDPLKWFPARKKSTILNRAVSNAKRVHDSSGKAIELLQEEDRSLRDFLIEFHNKFSLPMACLLFLFIGAPLGAIVRKGGVGLPIIVGVVFFLVFYVMMLQGKKMAREDVLTPWMGVWLPILLFVPLAILVTYEATANKSILNASTWSSIIKSIRRFFRRVFMLLNPAYRKKIKKLAGASESGQGKNIRKSREQLVQEAENERARILNSLRITSEDLDAASQGIKRPPNESATPEIQVDKSSESGPMEQEATESLPPPEQGPSIEIPPEVLAPEENPEEPKAEVPDFPETEAEPCELPSGLSEQHQEAGPKNPEGLPVESQNGKSSTEEPANDLLPDPGTDDLPR